LISFTIRASLVLKLPRESLGKVLNPEREADLSALLHRVQIGRDEAACDELWRTLHGRVVAVARQHMAAHSKRVADEEDVALSAMNSFFHAAEVGRLDHLHDRGDLWRVLLTITARKVISHQLQQNAAKRGGGNVRGDSVFSSAENSASNGFNSVEDRGDPQRFIDGLFGECKERLESLPDKTLQMIAIKRMEGYEVSEISSMLGVAVSTIKRKLARIRDLWAPDVSSEG